MLTNIEKWLTFKPDSIDHGALHNRRHNRLRFGAEFGLDLDGVWLPQKSDTAILFIHGNRHNVTKFAEHYDLFETLGLSCFTFDYPGYGLSSGAPSETALYASARAALSYLSTRLHYRPQQVIVYGCSLGGAVAIELTQHSSVAALITESTFTNSHDMGAILFPYMSLWKLLPRRFENDKKIGLITSPTLLIHGAEDPLVPVRMAHELFSLVTAPKYLEIVTHALHTDSLTRGALPLRSAICSFIERHSELVQH